MTEPTPSIAIVPSTHLFDCSENTAVECAYAVCCPWCVYGRLAQAADPSSSALGRMCCYLLPCHWLAGILLREKITQQTCCDRLGNGCAYLCCSPCALLEDQRRLLPSTPHTSSRKLVRQ